MSVNDNYIGIVERAGKARGALAVILNVPAIWPSIVPAVRDLAAENKRLRATLDSVINAYDRSKDEQSPKSAVSMIRAAVEPARAVLREDSIADGFTTANVS